MSFINTYILITIEITVRPLKFVSFSEYSKMDEKPIKLKKQRPICHLNTECIVHYDAVRDDKCTPLTPKSLSAIQSAAKIRQSFGRTDYDRQHDICHSLPFALLQHHGCHRQCYQRFTSTSRLQKQKAGEDGSDSEQAPKSSNKKRKGSHSSSDHDLLSQKECIFCGKRVKKTAKKFENLIKVQSKSREDARYHLSCYHHFIPPVGPSSKSDTDKAMHLAHENAFRYICKYVEDSIIHGTNVEQITMLKEKYLLYMYENHCEFYNIEYKTDKLKNKLMKCFGKKINFGGQIIAVNSSIPLLFHLVKLWRLLLKLLLLTPGCWKKLLLFFVEQLCLNTAPQGSCLGLLLQAKLLKTSLPSNIATALY